MDGDGLAQFGKLYFIIASGHTPISIAPLLASSTFIALAKFHDGIRPIAIVECLYRIIARALLYEHRDALRSFFARDQFAIATPAGCEALALGARCLSEAYPTHAFLQLDVTNVFNTISRSTVLESIRDSHLVTVFPFVRSFYYFATPLHYVCRATRHVVSLLSTIGTRQGDPLSGVLFVFGLHTALSRVQARTPAALICTYEDDIMVHGPPKVLPAAFYAYAEETAAVGLLAFINMCRVWLPAGAVLPVELLSDVARVRG